MTQSLSLKDKSTYVLNFTNRIDLDRGEVTLDISARENGLQFEVCISTWAAIRPRISPEMNLTLALTRGGTADTYVDLGPALRAVNAQGQFTGSIDSWLDPTSFGARLMISDPRRSHAIVVGAKIGRPNIVIEDYDEQDVSPVRPFSKSAGRESGLIDVFETEMVSGHWNLNLNEVEVPQLMVSKRLGKERVVNDPLIQNVIFPEVFRKVVTALVLDPERFIDEPWVEDWKKLATGFSPTSEWDFYQGDDDEIRSIEERIGEGVAGYMRLLPSIPLLGRTKDTHEDSL
jgi:hypothetical protein